MNEDINAQLRAAFHFTDGDLQANRDGIMTAAQRQQLEANALSYWKKAGLTVLVVLISTVFGTVGVAFNPNPYINVEDMPIAFLVISALTVIFLVWLYTHERQVHAEIRAGRVTASKGRLKIIEPETGSVGRFQVRKRTFRDLSQAQFDAMRHLNETQPIITIYHPPNHDRVLSVDIHDKQQ